MNDQTNAEQKDNKVAASGINPEVIKLDFNQPKDGLSGFVRGTVGEALNGLLQAEAEDLCSAKRHERNEGGVPIEEWMFRSRVGSPRDLLDASVKNSPGSRNSRARRHAGAW